MTPKLRLLLIIGVVGTAGCALIVTDTHDPSKQLWGAVGAVLGAVFAMVLVSLSRHRVLSADAGPRTPSRFRTIAAVLLGIGAAMAVPRSSFDPVIVGAITGGLLAVAYWVGTPARPTDN